MKRRAYRTPVLCAYAFLFSAGSFNPALSEEGPPSPPPVSSDGKIALLLVDIENALMTGGMAPELSDKLIEARTLWSTASLDGRRMLIEFPDRLQKDQARLPKDEDETTLINLRVFGRVAAQYIEEMATYRKPVEPPAHVDNAPDQVAIVAPTAPPQVTTPPPPPPKPESVATSPPQIRPSQTTIALLDRGNAMFDLGDIAAARLLFRRAAELGSGRAAMKLANTYDPGWIGGHNVIGIQPDLATAAIWYRKAVALGEPQANERLVVMVERLSR